MCRLGGVLLLFVGVIVKRYQCVCEYRILDKALYSRFLVVVSDLIFGMTAVHFLLLVVMVAMTKTKRDCGEPTRRGAARAASATRV